MTGGRSPVFRESVRLARVPPYPFAELERIAAERDTAERPVLRFAIGDPDLPPPPTLTRALARILAGESTHRYSTSRGEPTLRDAIARFLKVRFGVSVDPEREVAVLVGTKEGLTALPRAILSPGASVAVPDPGYPAYAAAVLLADLAVERLPLRPDGGWLPDWEGLSARVGMTYLNYPNNPTGQVARLEDLREAVDLARDRRFVLAYDNAYSEITYTDAPAPSLLEVPGAREVALEFHSFSKTFGIPGWRLGFAVGHPELIRLLVRLKSQSDSGAATPLQRAAAEGLNLYRGRNRPTEVDRLVRIYRERMERLAEGLSALGQEVVPPRGGLSLWQRVRSGGEEYAERLLERAGVLLTPGSAFGRAGAEYVRWAVTRPRAEIDLALDRLPSALARAARPSAGDPRSSARKRSAARRGTGSAGSR
ncbi:MAG: pyridoxal phosphate-dependent aminotransferase [Thermoplasmata archaeon]